MARRRRRTSGPLKPLLLLALLAGAAYAAWRYAPTHWLRRAEPGSNAEEAVVLPAPNPAKLPLDVCALVEAEALRAALHASTIEARHVGAAADVPAAGACTWTFARDGRGGTLVALLFTRDSLRGSAAADLHGSKYYHSMLAGLEYAYKEAPVVLTGIGDEAAAAGFGSGMGDAQMVVRHGDNVLNLVVKGADRAATERAATLLAPRI
jgi:hypothetical protein